MTHAEHAPTDHYYVPHHSHWPIVASISLFILMYGGATLLNGGSKGILLLGLTLLLITIFGWFGTVIREGEKGMYSCLLYTSRCV